MVAGQNMDPRYLILSRITDNKKPDRLWMARSGFLLLVYVNFYSSIAIDELLKGAGCDDRGLYTFPICDRLNPCNNLQGKGP